MYISWQPQGCFSECSGDSVFAFGPYLSIGIAVAALYSEQIGSWYMDFTGLNEMMNEAMLIIR